jgi:hypothetical protein
MPEHTQRRRIAFPNTGILFVILGAFAKLRIAANAFVMSFCLAICMEQLGTLWTDLYKI